MVHQSTSFLLGRLQRQLEFVPILVEILTMIGNVTGSYCVRRMVH